MKIIIRDDDVIKQDYERRKVWEYSEEGEGNNTVRSLTIVKRKWEWDGGHKLRNRGLCW